jgi:hypothetical protein
MPAPCICAPQGKVAEAQALLEQLRNLRAEALNAEAKQLSSPRADAVGPGKPQAAADGPASRSPANACTPAARARGTPGLAGAQCPAGAALFARALGGGRGNSLGAARSSSARSGSNPPASSGTGAKQDQTRSGSPSLAPEASPAPAAAVGSRYGSRAGTAEPEAAAPPPVGRAAPSTSAASARGSGSQPPPSLGGLRDEAEAAATSSAGRGRRGSGRDDTPASAPQAFIQKADAAAAGVARLRLGADGTPPPDAADRDAGSTARTDASAAEPEPGEASTARRPGSAQGSSAAAPAAPRFRSGNGPPPRPAASASPEPEPEPDLPASAAARAPARASPAPQRTAAAGSSATPPPSRVAASVMLDVARPPANWDADGHSASATSTASRGAPVSARAQPPAHAWLLLAVMRAYARGEPSSCGQPRRPAPAGWTRRSCVPSPGRCHALPLPVRSRRGRVPPRGGGVRPERGRQDAPPAGEPAVGRPSRGGRTPSAWRGQTGRHVSLLCSAQGVRVLSQRAAYLSRPGPLRRRSFWRCWCRARWALHGRGRRRPGCGRRAGFSHWGRPQPRTGARVTESGAGVGHARCARAAAEPDPGCCMRVCWVAGRPAAAQHQVGGRRAGAASVRRPGHRWGRAGRSGAELAP